VNSSERVYNRIYNLQESIFQLNIRQETELSESEICKIEKRKKKLQKEIDKLYKKLNNTES
jgi:hypothetical protein